MCGKIYPGGEAMASIRIDNFSGDTVTVLLGDREEIIADEGKVIFDSVPKGTHSLKIHRTRVPFESVDSHESEQGEKMLFGTNEKSLHTQLDLITELDINSSKSVITLRAEVSSEEGKGIDAIFSSYSVTVTGAKNEKNRKVFANSSVQKKFISYHIKNVLFPAGVGGLVIFALGLLALVSHLTGNTLNLGGTQFNLPWSLGLTACGTGFVGYSLLCIMNVFKTAKRFKR